MNSLVSLEPASLEVEIFDVEEMNSDEILSVERIPQLESLDSALSITRASVSRAQVPIGTYQLPFPLLLSFSLLLARHLKIFSFVFSYILLSLFTIAVLTLFYSLFYSLHETKKSRTFILYLATVAEDIAPGQKQFTTRFEVEDRFEEGPANAKGRKQPKKRHFLVNFFNSRRERVEK